MKILFFFLFLSYFLCQSSFSLPVKSLTLATCDHLFPFSYIDPLKKKLRGFEIDLARAIAHYLGVKLHIKLYDIDDIYTSLEKRQADFAMAALTPIEKSDFLFSHPYYTSFSSLIVKKGSSIHTLKGLAHKKIGIQKNSIYENFIKRLAQSVAHIDIIEVEKNNDLLQAIQSEKIHATITLEVSAKNILKKIPSLTYYTLEEKMPIAVALPARFFTRTNQFNKAIDVLKNNGTFDRLYKKWFIYAVQSAEFKIPYSLNYTLPPSLSPASEN